VSGITKNHIIWDRFREGSKEALEYIYEGNYSALYYYGLKFTRDSNFIKDTIHELFMELINSGERLARTGNIRYYLLKSLRNKLIRQLKENQTIAAGQSGDLKFSLLESVENQLINKNIEEKVRVQINSAIKKLSFKQQEIIYLRFYNDMPYQEIAEMFGVKIQTVRNLMSRALKSLKDDFQRKGISKHITLFILKLPL